MKALIIALLSSSLITFLSYYIAREWIDEITQVIGLFSYLVVLGMVFIPCFAMIFTTTTLLFKQKKYIPLKEFPSVSVLIACYNEEYNIVSTINSVLNQKYEGNLEIIVADDGSEDNSLIMMDKQMDLNPNWKGVVWILRNDKNRGKSAVLNDALNCASYDTIITIDSDTILHKNALDNLISKFKSDNYAAVAGSIRVINDKENIWTRMQYWDYLIGIASVKQAQGIYDSTLVAQGAFSCYKREVLNTFKWSKTMGEDIVLSWNILKSGYKIGHANDAIVFTVVPDKYINFFKQRKRWSIGLIEAFRRNWSILHTPSKGLPFIWYNLLFPFIDVSYLLFFVPSVILAIFFHYYLMAGLLTLLLLPLGLLLNSVIMLIQRKINKEVDLKFNGDFIGFLLFILFYQLIQTPATIAGYVSEIFRLKKSWGTRKHY